MITEKDYLRIQKFAQRHLDGKLAEHRDDFVQYAAERIIRTKKENAELLFYLWDYKRDVIFKHKFERLVDITATVAPIEPPDYMGKNHFKNVLVSLVMMGYKLGEIADMAGVKTATVSKWLKAANKTV